MIRVAAALVLLASLSGISPALAQGSNSGRDVTCESNDGRYRECRAPYNGPARVSRQLSDTRCVEGRNWGSRPGLIWVDAGCRARFSADNQGWPTWGNYNGQREITCESKDERYRQCNSDFRGRARISRQLSQNACIEGRSWGQGPGFVWVARGCRARFEDTRWQANDGRRDDDYDRNDRDGIVCESQDNRRRNCNWNSRSRPRLIQQLSDNRCVEGQSWGYYDGTLWVDRGCRGRFGSR